MASIYSVPYAGFTAPVVKRLTTVVPYAVFPDGCGADVAENAADGQRNYPRYGILYVYYPCTIYVIYG